MANNYTTTAFIIPMNREQAVWAIEVAELCCDILTGEVDPAENNFNETEFLPGVVDAARDLSGRFYGVGISHTEYMEEYSEHGLYVSGDESPDLEFIAAWLQATLVHFNLPGPVGFSWADVSDKPRAGEFGGGAVAIWPDRTEWVNAAGWLEKQLGRFKPEPVRVVVDLFGGIVHDVKASEHVEVLFYDTNYPNSRNGHLTIESGDVKGTRAEIVVAPALVVDDAEIRRLFDSVDMDAKRFPVEDWKYEVSNGDTVLGYDEWLMHQVEAEG